MKSSLSKDIILSRFYKDFNIFPEILSLFQIKSLFFSLSDIYCANSYQTNNKCKITFIISALNNLDPNKTTSSNEVINKTKRNVNSNKNINYDLFLESLAVTALTMKCFNNEYNDVYKVIETDYHRFYSFLRLFIVQKR